MKAAEIEPLKAEYHFGVGSAHFEICRAAIADDPDLKALGNKAMSLGSGDFAAKAFTRDLGTEAK